MADLVVDTGLNEVRNLMSSGTGGTDTPPTIGVVGSHAFTPGAGDTTLVGSFFGDSFDVNTVANKTNQYELLIVANEGNGVIRSVGTFNSDSNLFTESTFTSITKTGSMEVQMDINIAYTSV